LVPEQSILLSTFIDSLPIKVVGTVLSLSEAGDDVELAPSRPQVIASVFLHPWFISRTSADGDRYVRQSTGDIRAFDL
jgi:hypothetical protein